VRRGEVKNLKSKYDSNRNFPLGRFLNALIKVALEESIPVALDKLDPKLKKEYLKIKRSMELDTKQEQMRKKKFENEIIITDYRIIDNDNR
jgi:hypothetical protein